MTDPEMTPAEAARATVEEGMGPARLSHVLRGALPPVGGPAEGLPPRLRPSGRRPEDALQEFDRRLALVWDGTTPSDRELRGLLGHLREAIGLVLAGMRTMHKDVRDLDARAPDLDTLADPMATPPPGLPPTLSERCVVPGCATPPRVELLTPGGPDELLCAPHLVDRLPLPSGSGLIPLRPRAETGPARVQRFE